MTWFKRYKLEFDDPDEETRFSTEYCKENNDGLKKTLPAVAALCLIFVGIHAFIGISLQSGIVRSILIGAIAGITGWGLTFSERLSKYNQGICTFFAGALLVATVVVQTFTAEPQYSIDNFAIVLMLTVSILRLRFKYTAICVITVWAALLISTVLKTSFKDYSFAVPALIIIGFSIIVLGISYLLEQKRRGTFASLRKLSVEKSRSDSLLDAVLPQQVKNQIQAGETAPRHLLPETLVVFLEVKQSEGQEFSETSLYLLDGLFRKLDSVIRQGQCETIKTFGYEYVFASAVHPGQKLNFNEVYETIDTIIRICDEDKWKIRGGAAVGPVAAGVVGTRTLAFDVWGKSVNIAARLKQISNWGEFLATRNLSDRIRFPSALKKTSKLKGIGNVEIVSVPTGQFRRLAA